MPGPMSAPTQDVLRTNKDHDRCQDRARCTGPGCRVRTGKTTTNRSK